MLWRITEHMMHDITSTGFRNRTTNVLQGIEISFFDLSGGMIVRAEDWVAKVKYEVDEYQDLIGPADTGVVVERENRFKNECLAIYCCIDSKYYDK